jgi:hypothetical protein
MQEGGTWGGSSAGPIGVDQGKGVPPPFNEEGLQAATRGGGM